MRKQTSRTVTTLRLHDRGCLPPLLGFKNVESLREGAAEAVADGNDEIAACAQNIGRYGQPLAQRQDHIRAGEHIISPAGLPVRCVQHKIPGVDFLFKAIGTKCGTGRS